MPAFKLIVESLGQLIDAAGVVIIVVGIAIASARFILEAVRPPQRRPEPAAGAAYRAYRQSVGRSILLGLELLVAGDIIRTVAIAPTLESVAVLGVIVIIRTFLSMSLQVELEGRWPWRTPRRARDEGPAPAAV